MSTLIGNLIKGKNQIGLEEIFMLTFKEKIDFILKVKHKKIRRNWWPEDMFIVPTGHFSYYEDYFWAIKSIDNKKREFTFLDDCFDKKLDVYWEFYQENDQSNSPLKSEKGFKLELICEHDWKYYQGFTECYEFCTKCQEKRLNK
jgi:hypothetical protein